MFFMNRLGKWKVLAALASGVIAWTAARADASKPIKEFLFDEPAGFNALNTGSSSTLAPALEMIKNTNGVENLNNSHGLGVAGGGLDQSFVDGSTSGQAQDTGGGNNFAINDTNVNNLASFTLMGWMKRDGASVVGNERRIVYKSNGTAGFRLEGGESGSQDYLRLWVDGSTVLSGNAYSSVNEWTYFAVTYDGTIATNNVNFYIGTLSGGNSNAVLVNTTTLNQGTTDNNGDLFAVGGIAGGNISRSFDGSLDVIRVFGSHTDNSGALSLSQIQVWQSDIPEPSIAMLFGVSGLLLWRVRRRE
jgi:hypothetical protein